MKEQAAQSFSQILEEKGITIQDQDDHQAVLELYVKHIPHYAELALSLLNSNCTDIAENIQAYTELLNDKSFISCSGTTWLGLFEYRDSLIKAAITEEKRIHPTITNESAEHNAKYLVQNAYPHPDSNITPEEKIQELYKHRKATGMK